jgi:ABC-type glutathione transport system ATPase component
MNLVRHDLGFSKTDKRFPMKGTCLSIYSRAVNAEAPLFRRFKELSEGKTAILISHRFSSVRMADRILVLADGKVEAAGTHEELVSRPGEPALHAAVQVAAKRLGISHLTKVAQKADPLKKQISSAQTN